MPAPRVDIDPLNLYTTRAEAQAAGDRYYFTLKPCVKGHLEARQTSSGHCLQCDRDRTNQRRAADPQYAARLKELSRERYARLTQDPEWRETRTRQMRDALNRSPEQLDRKRRNAAEYKRHPEQIEKRRTRDRLRYHSTVKLDPELVAKDRHRGRQWAKANKERCNQKTAYRRALRRSACPHWVDEPHQTDIRYLYTWARVMTVFTGVPHEVDHIVPLKHEDVCGLHVVWNLQVLPRSRNRAKANNFEG